jgi:basic membrane protein A
MAAGAATTTNKIGYVAAFPIPEVIRGINAFALGAQRVNPEAEVEVAWTATWFDPTVEGNTAQALLDAGADVLTMHQDSTATGQAATDAGATFIGYHSDMSSQVGNYLTAPVWDWTNRYSDVINAAKDGTYTPESWWGGMAEGVVDIEIPSDSPVSAEMQEVKDLIIAGDFDVFEGEIFAQDGTVMVAAGEKLDDGAMLSMSMFVEGVIGSAES